jgi:PilZ domain
LPKLDPLLAALAASLPEPGFDRRTEARYPAQDPVELELLPLSAGPLYGTILDVSRSGLRIALSQRLGRGQQVRVKLAGNVILGEVRYSRAVSGGFQAGIRIQDFVRPPEADRHIADDPLSLYAVGKGLRVHEVIEIREHLGRCETCRARLGQKEALLKPARKTRSYLLPRD